MTVFFADAALEIFETLPEETKRRAAFAIDLIAIFPQMYPIRYRGLMRGYRYFIAGRYLIYYSVSSSEIRVAAIIPAAMRRA